MHDDIYTPEDKFFIRLLEELFSSGHTLSAAHLRNAGFGCGLEASEVEGLSLDEIRALGLLDWLKYQEHLLRPEDAQQLRKIANKYAPAAIQKASSPSKEE